MTTGSVGVKWSRSVRQVGRRGADCVTLVEQLDLLLQVVEQLIRRQSLHLAVNDQRYFFVRCCFFGGPAARTGVVSPFGVA